MTDQYLCLCSHPYVAHVETSGEDGPCTECTKCDEYVWECSDRAMFIRQDQAALDDMPNEDELEEALLAVARELGPCPVVECDRVAGHDRGKHQLGTIITLKWRSEKPDVPGWWLFSFPTHAGPCIESSYWNEEYLELERQHPAYNNRDGVWSGPIETP